jgi:hypothetical protein
MDSHYQLGSFKPLIDANQFEHRNSASARAQDEGFTKSSNQLDTNISPERRASARRQHPPIALNNKVQLADDEPLANLARNGSINRRGSLNKHRVADKRQALADASSTEFHENGLLGRKYSQRRRDVSEKEAQQEEPWTTGPNLLNGGLREEDLQASSGGVRRQTSTRRQPTSEVKRSSSTQGRTVRDRRGSNDLVRADTRARHGQNQSPKPLVDLTPEYREAPQFSKKNLGKGYVPDAVGEGGLIDSATSPEDPLGIPSSTDWRHRNANPGAYQQDPTTKATSGSGSGGSGGLQRGASLRNGSKSRSPDATQTQTGFTGDGLLAQVNGKQGWSGESKGRGVVVDREGMGSGRALVDLSR